MLDTVDRMVELRLEALKLALSSASHLCQSKVQDVVATAEAFYDFLTGCTPLPEKEVYEDKSIISEEFINIVNKCVNTKVATSRDPIPERPELIEVAPYLDMAPTDTTYAALPKIDYTEEADLIEILTEDQAAAFVFELEQSASALDKAINESASTFYKMAPSPTYLERTEKS